MDPEASYGDESLTASVSLRRRSHSFSDDYSIQRTNDDATQCKLAAVQLGYWKDEFLSRFVQRCPTNSFRRDPEISIGYWARVSVINHLVERFVEKTAGRCQIINIGCGSDTLFWRLKSSGKLVQKFVDVDFSSVTAKKIRQIRKPGAPDLVSFFSEPPKEIQHSDLHCGDYSLVGADLRQWNEFRSKLDSVGIDTTLPTLFVAEDQLFYNVHTKDTFGNIMEKNLEQRGIQLPGIAACSDVETQKGRTSDSAFNPPGFHPGVTSAQHHVDSEHASEQQEHLAKKRAWDVAMAPAKSLPMNMFMMYMAGRSVSIFPIMMVGMMLWRPVKALFSVNATFKPLEDQNAGSLIIHKIIFILGNMGAIALAIYKVHTMGLLPNTPSDWLEFIPQPQRVQYSIVSNTYV
ncbi:unnamed protein product [Angiostrongylus costaricensis]|uniref:ER membrane protein complex subunit 4 n=1 Tax=Angiostrongylus costaricensis TaxID=334426 RepID=A0A0R3PW57_ANGCS|nr:unnamed protein product [Angiostrongylus costaricensis]